MPTGQLKGQFQSLISFPFFSTIIISKNRPFSLGLRRFSRKIRIPGYRMDMEGTPRSTLLGTCEVARSSMEEICVAVSRASQDGGAKQSGQAQQHVLGPLPDRLAETYQPELTRLWVKTNGIPSWGRGLTTQFRTYFSGWIGMFTGGTGF